MTRLYRALTGLFPRGFRQHYRDEMLRALAERRGDASRGGRWRLLRFDAGAASDLLINAGAERLRAGRTAASGLLHDGRFAIRMLTRRPALSLFSASTLGVAIGAVTAVAAIVHAVIISPLPFPRPTELIAIHGEIEGRRSGISYENLRDLEEQWRSFAAASPFFAQSVNLTGVAEPDRLRAGFVTSDFFDVIGLEPSIGARFGSTADVNGAARVAVLTYEAWNTRFGGRPDIIGHGVQLNNAPFTIVGVMPPTFTFPIDDVDVFLPFWATTAGTDRDNHNYLAIGRLAPGATITAAREEAAAAAADLERLYPETNRGRGVGLEPFKDMLLEGTAYPVQLLAVMVAIILIAACGSVAALYLGDTSSRRREIAVRAALGAGRVRITRQLILESLARAALGGTIGIGVAAAALAFIASDAPVDVFGIESVRLNGPALTIAVAVTLLAGAATGLPAALQWSRTGALAEIGAGERTIGEARSSLMRSALVTSQIAIASVLLVVVGLTARSFERLASVDVGFDPRQVLTMEYRIPRNKYPSAAAQAEFHRRVLERVRALPGITGAASVRALPFSGNGSRSAYSSEHEGEPRSASFNAVSDGYFETMGIPLVAGRTFDASKGDDPVVVVSRTLAERTWPEERAVGRRVYFDTVDIVATVIGVVGDVRHRELADDDLAAIYTSQEQNPSVFNTLAVRTGSRALPRAADVRAAVWSVDPDQPVWKIRTLESLIDGSLATRRFLLQLVLFFAVSTAAVAVLGLYGVVASLVAQRTREIGVRVAMGATPRRVLSMILWSGLRLGLVGITGGLFGALVVANLLRSFLYTISPHDPLTFAGAAFALLAAALLACGIPAVRALSVDPVNALRS